MLIPVRCFTCGKVIADKYDYYIAEMEKLSVDKDTTTQKHKHFDAIQTNKIMDALGLSRYCCRRHMISQVDLMETI